MNWQLVKSALVNLVFMAVVGSSAVLAYKEFSAETPSPDTTKSEIVGPEAIEYPGQLALFKLSTPKPAKDLVCIWGVESFDSAVTIRPDLVPTGVPGETLMLTPAGRWRLSCAFTDPSARTGQMLSREVLVPAAPISPKPVPPEPSPPAPLPAPSPGPQPGPGPAPLPQPPAPANRFSDLTASVRTWLADVTSPNKAAEVASLRTGAADVVSRLQAGNLSQLTGSALELAVVRAVQASNSSAVRGNPAAWDAFGKQVGTYAGQALSSGKLATAKDWAELLQAFADGLKG